MGGKGAGYKRGCRISRRAEIRGLIASRNRVREGDVELYWRIGDPRRGVRGGVIIGARWRGDKPARNRFRRRYREALRLIMPELKPGVDLLVRLKPGKSDTSQRQEDAAETVLSLVTTAGLLGADSSEQDS